MLNKAMERMLDSGEAISVLRIGKEIGPGLYELSEFIPDIDYCDARREYWIWSIGKELSTGKIFASTNTKFYGADGFECLWLR